MSDFFQFHFEQVERRLRALAGELTRLQAAPFRPRPCWTPAVNVYVARTLVICADLAGVKARDLTIEAEPGRCGFGGIATRRAAKDAGASPCRCWPWKLIMAASNANCSCPMILTPAGSPPNSAPAGSGFKSP